MRVLHARLGEVIYGAPTDRARRSRPPIAPADRGGRAPERSISWTTSWPDVHRVLTGIVPLTPDRVDGLVDRLL
ncbi:hypothetical protein [Streptomyces sp. NPDC102409]|uniref:hypothetical protein n=1 Tax=Streptomyces sp. NPDC102409 TaxID=3366172 RepID=UPI0037FC2489